MKNYTRPVIVVADQLAEGVYMSLSGDNQVAFTNAVDAASGSGETIDNTNAADLTTGAENSVGGTEESDTSSDTTQDSSTNETQGDQTGEGDSTGEPVGDMQSSVSIKCESKYMEGIWQGAHQGATGETVPTNKGEFGCSDCPADKGDGCGLQDPDAASVYFNDIGRLKPGWEQLGKLPDDNPYGL